MDGAIGPFSPEWPDKSLKSLKCHLTEFWRVFDNKNRQSEANAFIFAQDPLEEIGSGII
jgi:hypothetical protein